MLHGAVSDVVDEHDSESVEIVLVDDEENNR